MLEVPTVDQVNFEAARFEQIEDRNPIHASGFHGDRVDATGHQPIRQGLQIDREGAKDADIFGGTVRRDAGPDFTGSDVQTGGVRMNDFQVFNGLNLLGGTVFAIHASSP
jgi:hypothetical protein